MYTSEFSLECIFIHDMGVWKNKVHITKVHVTDTFSRIFPPLCRMCCTNFCNGIEVL
jgi:hypothetical protein